MGRNFQRPQGLNPHLAKWEQALRAHAEGRAVHLGSLGGHRGVGSLWKLLINCLLGGHRGEVQQQSVTPATTGCVSPVCFEVGSC